jgi:homoserine kinase
LAADIEGHPDNVAACLYGGFTIAWRDGTGVRATRLEPSIDLAAVAFICGVALATEQARRLLPAQVPHADAASNAARAGLLVAAIRGDHGLLIPATEDWLHQDYRAPAMPESADLLSRLRAAGHAAVISGAGPTVLAITTGERADMVLNVRHDGFEARRVGFGVGGATAVVSRR